MNVNVEVKFSIRTGICIIFLLNCNSICANSSEYIARPKMDYAILIAVNQYENLEDLSNPISDARQLAEKLETEYEFETEVVENPTRKEIKEKLEYYRDQFENGSFDREGQLFIFLTGHGIFDIETDNGFFIPADGDPDDLQATALPYYYWRPFIDKMKCKHVLVVIDACYSGTFDRRIVMKSGNGDTKPNFNRPRELSDTERLLANQKKRISRLYLTSSAIEKTPDKSGFTKQFLEALEDGSFRGDIFTVAEVYALYLEKVSPTPLFGAFGKDDPGSNFIFFHKNWQHPDKGAKNGKPQAEIEVFKEAKLLNTIEAYEAYLKKYPDGLFAEAALAGLEKLKAELDRVPKAGISLSSLDLSTEWGKRTKQKIETLRKAAGTTISDKSNPSRLLVATWNIRDFDSSAYGYRTEESFHYIAEILSHFDIIAVQEVRSDLEPVEKLMRILGNNWGYQITGVTDGSSGNNERLGFVYDKRKVRFGNVSDEIVLTDEKQIARTPFVAKFIVNGQPIIFCTTHIIYADGKPNSPERAWEIEKIVQNLVKQMDRNLYGADKLVLLGDLNIFSPSSSSINILKENNFVLPDFTLTANTNLTNTKPYSQLAFYSSGDRFPFTFLAGGVFDFFRYLYTAEEEALYKSAMGDSYLTNGSGDPRTEEGSFRYYFTYWRTNQLSDQLPKWVEVEID
ncbi:MAG: caspase family protein [Lewinellaceae bacterium]|nr:caspase family protein [Lewinellaceae bacterium]